MFRNTWGKHGDRSRYCCLRAWNQLKFSRFRLLSFLGHWWPWSPINLGGCWQPSLSAASCPVMMIILIIMTMMMMLRMRMMMLRMMMLVLVGFDDCFLLLYVWAAAFSEASTCCNWIFTRPWLEYLSYLIFQWFIGIVCFVFWTVGVFVMLHFSLSRHCHATSPPSWISGFKSLFSGWDIILELDQASQSQILLPGMFVKYMQHLFMFYGGQSEQFHLWQWQHRQMTPNIRFRWNQRVIPRRNPEKLSQDHFFSVWRSLKAGLYQWQWDNHDFRVNWGQKQKSLMTSLFFFETWSSSSLPNFKVIPHF